MPLVSAVSISGDTAVVGTLAGDVGSNANQGVAYIFERHQGGTDNWGLVKTLTAPDGAKDDKFGLGVAISNDTVVVGAPFADVGGHSNQGAAYIFQRNAGGPNNWGEIKKIAAADGTANNQFGASIDISNDTIVVGVNSLVVALPTSLKKMRAGQTTGVRSKNCRHPTVRPATASELSHRR